MIITKAHTITLKGTNYEVGYKLGKIVAVNEVYDEYFLEFDNPESMIDIANLVSNSRYY